MNSTANLSASQDQEGMILLSFPLAMLLTMQFNPFPYAGSGTRDTFVGSKKHTPFFFFQD